MTDVQAAIGREQLKRLPGIVAERRALAAALCRRSSPASTASPCRVEPAWARSNWQSYCVAPRPTTSTSAPSCSMLDRGVAAAARHHVHPPRGRPRRPADAAAPAALRGGAATTRSSCRSTRRRWRGAGRRSSTCSPRRSQRMRPRAARMARYAHEPARLPIGTPMLEPARCSPRSRPGSRPSASISRGLRVVTEAATGAYAVHRDRSRRSPGPGGSPPSPATTRGTARPATPPRDARPRGGRRGRRPDQRHGDAPTTSDLAGCDILTNSGHLRPITAGDDRAPAARTRSSA